MSIILLGGPGFPAIEQMIILVLPIAIVPWLLTVLFDWLKTKPWKRKSDGLQVAHSGNSSNGDGT